MNGLKMGRMIPKRFENNIWSISVLLEVVELLSEHILIGWVAKKLCFIKTANEHTVRSKLHLVLPMGLIQQRELCYSIRLL